MEQNKTSSKKLINKVFVPLIIMAFLIVGIIVGTNYFKKMLYTVMKVPDFELVDQNGKTITNKDMLGKVYLVEFFYSTCPTICPVMNANMKNIDKEINDPNFGIISISIDPKNDTPEILKQHAEKIGATDPNWHFLTGDRDYIGKLADQFAIYVGDKEDKAENLNHSGMIALVDKNGNIRCRLNKEKIPILYYSGLNYEDPEGTIENLVGKYHPDVESLIEDIRKLLN